MTERDDPLAWLEWHLESYKYADDPLDRAYHAKQILRYAKVLNEPE